MQYTDWFKILSGFAPHPWQTKLAAKAAATNRLIRIPTGMGKTLGVIGAWLWHRAKNNKPDWPRRLVWCLPMRVLVEQTEAEAKSALENFALLWKPEEEHTGKVGLHILMGGADAGDWALYPEENAVLIGTQDMLLSRAMNRGYASPRARWPMEFGLLNQDCLWVMDEVQLMDVGLATSAQLQAFRDSQAAKCENVRPCKTWWMSATLQNEWLKKSPDTKLIAEEAESGEIRIPGEERSGLLWDGVARQLRVESLQNTKQLAEIVAKEHAAISPDESRLTLVVLNTVNRALEMAKELRRLKASEDIRLIHSRFRPQERKTWTDFLNRAACESCKDRIIVSTQVIEAGVDISARLLITELAPWPSLVQRFGRSARWGGNASVIVADLNLPEKKTAPYQYSELQAAKTALELLADASPAALEDFEAEHKEQLAALYPYEPTHLIVESELNELFDTTPDLSGADIDISRFIRSGQERDCQIFWEDVKEGVEPLETIRPTRDALCSAPFLDVREWLFPKNKPNSKKRAWVWDWLDGKWRVAKTTDIWPGQTVLVASAFGGYDPESGWSKESKASVEPVGQPEASRDITADDAQDQEALSENNWCTIATHGARVGARAEEIIASMAPDFKAIFNLAGRLHDIGKAHPAFQACLTEDNHRKDWAKAPNNVWKKGRALYSLSNDMGGRRAGFRHELAGALALFGVLKRHAPEHPALLGPWQAFLEQAGFRIEGAQTNAEAPVSIEQEVTQLKEEQFDLLAYLVCSHHGKTRLSLHSSPSDQEANDTSLRIRGVREGDKLPQVLVMDAQGRPVPMPEALLDLSPAAMGLSPSTGSSWSERTLALVRKFGPFQLAWMEACLRAADIRVSRETEPDPMAQSETSFAQESQT